MKKLMILSLFFVGGIVSSYAKQLVSFNEVRESILRGEDINVITNFDKLIPKASAPNLFAAVKPKEIMLASSYISFASWHMTTNNPSYPGETVLENVTFVIRSNESIKITCRTITVPNFKTVNTKDYTGLLKESMMVYNYIN